jgi:hypothetical protein
MENFLKSLFPYAWNNLRMNKMIFIKFGIGEFYKNMSSQFILHLDHNFNNHFRQEQNYFLGLFYYIEKIYLSVMKQVILPVVSYKPTVVL